MINCVKEAENVLHLHVLFVCTQYGYLRGEVMYIPIPIAQVLDSFH
jgi:hypothetical protein